MTTVGIKKNAASPVSRLDGAIFAVFFLYSIISQYQLLTLFAGVVLIVLLKNLWKPFVPPVLLFFIGLQWLQVFTCILYADFKGQTIDALFSSKDTEFLLGMTFLHLLLISLVLHQFVKAAGNKIIDVNILRIAAAKINTRNVTIGYFLALLLFPILISFAGNNSSLLQLASTFSILKYLFTALLIFILFLKKTNNKLLLIGILILDFILSFASYFSDFKVILIMLILIYYTVNPQLRRATLYKMIPVVVALVVFFSFWSFIKGSYRSYLNQGAKEQVKTVSNKQALTYLVKQLVDFKSSDLQEGLTLFIYRAQYMERYSEVYARVPDKIPHQNGAELEDALEFLLIPRFINEDKGIKDASLRTSHYTGKTFSNASQGTSISMGYFCDLYIDYGLYLMMIPLLCIAIMIGYLYRRLLSLKGYNVIFIYSLLIATFLSMGAFESDLIFFLGIFRNNLVFLVLGYFAFFPALQKFIFAKTK